MTLTLEAVKNWVESVTASPGKNICSGRATLVNNILIDRLQTYTQSGRNSHAPLKIKHEKPGSKLYQFEFIFNPKKNVIEKIYRSCDLPVNLKSTPLDVTSEKPIIDLNTDPDQELTKTTRSNLMTNLRSLEPKKCCGFIVCNINGNNGELLHIMNFVKLGDNVFIIDTSRKDNPVRTQMYEGYDNNVFFDISYSSNETPPPSKKIEIKKEPTSPRLKRQKISHETIPPTEISVASASDHMQPISYRRSIGASMELKVAKIYKDSSIDAISKIPPDCTVISLEEEITLCQVDAMPRHIRLYHLHRPVMPGTLAQLHTKEIDRAVLDHNTTKEAIISLSTVSETLRCVDFLPGFQCCFLEHLKLNKQTPVGLYEYSPEITALLKSQDIQYAMIYNGFNLEHLQYLEGTIKVALISQLVLEDKKHLEDFKKCKNITLLKFRGDNIPLILSTVLLNHEGIERTLTNFSIDCICVDMYSLWRHNENPYNKPNANPQNRYNSISETTNTLLWKIFHLNYKQAAICFRPYESIYYVATIKQILTWFEINLKGDKQSSKSYIKKFHIVVFPHEKEKRKVYKFTKDGINGAKAHLDELNKKKCQPNAESEPGINREHGTPATSQKGKRRLKPNKQNKSTQTLVSFYSPVSSLAQHKASENQSKQADSCGAIPIPGGEN